MSGIPIKFGTDGWRAVMARDFTFAAVRRVSKAVAVHLKNNGQESKGVAISFDRRLLSRDFALEAALTLAGEGVRAHLTPDYAPTPALSWAVREGGHALGMMITASHNPPEYNGIKIKEHHGCPSSSATNKALEKILNEEVTRGQHLVPMGEAEAKRRDLLVPLDLREGYDNAVWKLIDRDALGKNREVAFDAMHGNGAGWTDRLLREAGVNANTLRAEANPGFEGVGPEPVAARLGELMKAVTGGGLLLGVANDGDADRIAAIDERGAFFSPQRILAVLAKYLYEVKGHRGDIAKAVSASSLLDLIAKKNNLKVIEVPIGFRHIGELMVERPILIGGEESGAVGFGAHLPERDGPACALLLAEIVGRYGVGLREYIETLFAEFGRFVYIRKDIKLPPADIEAVRARMKEVNVPGTIAGLAVNSVVTIDGTKFVLDENSWLLIRPSGTEPLLRIYCEARSDEKARELLAAGMRLCGVEG